MLASSALVGHLNGMTSNGINIINALLLAKDAGISCTARHVTSKCAKFDLDRMLQLTIQRGLVHLDLIGTLLSNFIRLKPLRTR